VLHQAKSGVSAARNCGLREAQYPFVLFLDSDDRIAPTHLERMVRMLLADSTLDAVHCGWQRVLPSGVTGRPHFGCDEVDLFQHFAFHCHFPIHACVLRRDLALSVAGFDSSLITCEDCESPAQGRALGWCRNFWPFTTSALTLLVVIIDAA